MKNFTYKVPLALIAVSSLQQKAAALKATEEEPAKKASKCPFGYGGTTLAQDEVQAENPAENLYDLFNQATSILEQAVLRSSPFELITKPGQQDYAESAGIYHVTDKTFSGQKVYECEEAHRTILYYKDCWQVTSTNFWPAFEAGDDMRGGFDKSCNGPSLYDPKFRNYDLILHKLEDETLLRKQMVETYNDLFKQIYEAFDNLPTEISAHNNPRAEFVGCVLRSAGHDFMDYRDKIGGGSDGCVNFDHPDNKGIKECLIKTGMLEVFNNRKHRCSLADFLVIIAEAAMARSHKSYNSEDTFAEGTLAKTFRDGFRYNRKDQKNCENIGLMPDPEQGCFGRYGGDGLQQIFVEHIYKDRPDAWTLTAAINGAHTVGGAKLKNSGYNGYWSSVDQQGIFNNDYYVSLMTKGWQGEPKVNGNKKKNQWKRSDLPIDTTPEDLLLKYNKRKLSKGVYEAQLDRLLDPKRGLMENPVEGIKGHHEMMLNTDICLAYMSNWNFNDCAPGHRAHKRDPSSSLAVRKDQFKADCRVSLWEKDFYNENFADKSWTTCHRQLPQVMYDWGWSSKSVEKEFCGLNVTSVDPGIKTCCQNSYYVRDAGSVNWVNGPAYGDIAQFAANEEVWIRKFVEAWHIATENGVDSKAMNEESCQHRHDLEERHKTKCRGLTHDACSENEDCDAVIVGKAPDTKQERIKACRNKHLLVTEQQYEGETFSNYREVTAATLVNATQSSTISLIYPATNALNRQNAVQNRAEGKGWGKHSFLMDKRDTDPNAVRKNVRLMTSCAITEVVSEEQPTSWWQADFAEGELTVEQVEVHGEFYKAMYDRAYYGVKVFVDDQLCSEISVATRTSEFSGTTWFATPSGKRSTVKESSLFYAQCDSPLTGSSVRIETDRAPLETDLYESGLVICDIRVNLNTREPTFTPFDPSVPFTQDQIYNDRRKDLTKPTSQTEMGIHRKAYFEKASHVKYQDEQGQWIGWNGEAV